MHDFVRRPLEGLVMGSGGDRKHEEATDAQELFAYRYWYTWETAQKWPASSVVLCRYRTNYAPGPMYGYSLINCFRPEARQVAGQEYLLIERGK